MLVVKTVSALITRKFRVLVKAVTLILCIKLCLQQLNRRHLRRSKSLVSLLLWGDGEEDDGKAKNIRQTELLVDLREAILQVARHFQSLDPKNTRVVGIF